MHVALEVRVPEGGSRYHHHGTTEPEQNGIKTRLEKRN